MMPWIRAFISDCIDAAIKWIKRIWFESKLKARLTIIEWKHKIEFEKEKELEDNFKSIYSEEPHQVPGTEAAKLGGPMRLTAKWVKENKN